MKKIITSILFVIIAFFFISQKNVVHAVTFGCGDMNNNGGCVWAFGGPCANDPNGTIYMNAYCTAHAGPNCSNTTGNCDNCTSAGNTCQAPGCSGGYSPTPGTCTDPIAVCCRANNAPPPPPPDFGLKTCWEPQFHSDGFCVCGVYSGGTVYNGEPCPQGTYEQQPDCQDYCTTANNAPLPKPAPVPNDIKCGNNNDGINTAIGCIHVLGTPEAFLSDILKWAVGVGAGIAFLLVLYAGFMIMTASGNPERLKAGQELLTSALAGLILLIFSMFILRFIGVDILRLCKFGFGQPCQ